MNILHSMHFNLSCDLAGLFRYQSANYNFPEACSLVSLGGFYHRKECAMA